MTECEERYVLSLTNMDGSIGVAHSDLLCVYITNSV